MISNGRENRRRSCKLQVMAAKSWCHLYHLEHYLNHLMRHQLFFRSLWNFHWAQPSCKTQLNRLFSADCESQFVTCSQLSASLCFIIFPLWLSHSIQNLYENAIFTRQTNRRLVLPSLSKHTLTTYKSTTRHQSNQPNSVGAVCVLCILSSICLFSVNDSQCNCYAHFWLIS